MRYIYKTIARLDRLKLIKLSSLNKFDLSSSYTRAFYTQTPVPDTANMGKDKVSYQLKTPKGTKDCTSSPQSSS